MLRDPQRPEVVRVQLDLRPLDHLEPQPLEHVQDPATHLRDRMQPPLPQRPTRQRHVQGIRLRRGQRRPTQRLATLLERRLQHLLRTVRLGPHRLALLGVQPPDPTQHRRQLPRPTEHRQPPPLDGALIRRRPQRSQRIPLNRGNPVSRLTHGQAVYPRAGLRGARSRPAEPSRGCSCPGARCQPSPVIRSA